VPGKPSKRLFLKLGALVIFTRNVNLACGVANGTKGIVRRITRFRIDVEIITGPSIGEFFSCPRFNHKLSRSHRKGFTFNRLQFPMRLAYATTIHKSQGMTLSRCVIDCRAHASHHGCVYTAFSRVRLPADLGIILPSDGFGPLNLVHKRFVEVLHRP